MAILRAHVLSVRSSQLRFKVCGTRGTFIKYGLDTQEDQLKVLLKPNDIFAADFGTEPTELWGTVENIGADGSIEKSTQVLFATVTKRHFG
jgi:hypothetical protein